MHIHKWDKGPYLEEGKPKSKRCIKCDKTVYLYRLVWGCLIYHFYKENLPTIPDDEIKRKSKRFDKLYYFGLISLILLMVAVFFNLINGIQFLGLFIILFVFTAIIMELYWKTICLYAERVV